MIDPMFNDVDMIRVDCFHCGRQHTLTVSVDGFIAWQNGMLIQNALPELSADERFA